MGCRGIRQSGPAATRNDCSLSRCTCRGSFRCGDYSPRTWKGPNEPALKTLDPSREIRRPSKPIPIKKEIVNEDPIRESMEDLAEKLYGAKASAPSSRSNDDISELSSSLREALMEEDSS